MRTGAEALYACIGAVGAPMRGRRRVVAAGGLTTSPSRNLVASPRIVIDGVFFQLNQTGIARVWQALMTEWSASGFAQHVVVLDRLGTSPRLPGFTYRRMIPFRYHNSLAQSLAIESICRAEQADLFISTYYTTPRSTRSLLYVYDMIPEVLGFDLTERQWREKRAAVEHASAYVAISQNTATDLQRFYPAAESRPLLVAHNAAEPGFATANPAEVRRLIADLDLPEEYFVFLGARNVAYKNAGLVLDALALIEQAKRPAVLFVGGNPNLEDDLAARTCGTVVRVAALTDAQLVAAYSGARGLLYPSRYEGFGLPILEAMACGCPVVTCRNSSIPEVAGDAAVYVSEDDPAELAEAIRSLQGSSTRERYRSLGFDRVRQFDWGRTASEVERFIRDVATGGR